MTVLSENIAEASFINAKKIATELEILPTFRQRNKCAIKKLKFGFVFKRLFPHTV
jgi:hypothetical protein